MIHPIILVWTSWEALVPERDSQTVVRQVDWTKHCNAPSMDFWYSEREAYKRFPHHPHIIAYERPFALMLIAECLRSNNWSTILIKNYKTDKSWYRGKHHFVATDPSRTYPSMKWHFEQSLVGPLSQLVIGENKTLISISCSIDGWWMWFSSGQWVTSHEQSESDYSVPRCQAQTFSDVVIWENQTSLETSFFN